MISYLKGKVILKKDDFIILNNQGIGFKVFLSEDNLKEIKKEQEVELFSFLDVKERSLDLYGFLKIEELELFKTLKNVSGVGSKVALKISSFGSLKKIEKAIEEKKTDVFEEIKGVGKKRAQKIILELTGKIEERKKGKVTQEEDVVQALANLGFSKKRAKEALAQVSSNIEDKEKRIKEALKILGK